jgi:hypothetical protein
MPVNTDAKEKEMDQRPQRKLLRVAVVLAGIVAGQFLLYGPSLTGQKILLPLDILAQHGIYVPRQPGAQDVYAQHPILADLVFQFEPARRFAAKEFGAGRFPWWSPYQYGGAPFIWPKYSPFFLLASQTESPVALAWVQLLAALVAGTGAYAFCRVALRVSFWPATIVAWCHPLTGFFIFWQGYPTCGAV